MLTPRTRKQDPVWTSKTKRKPEKADPKNQIELDIRSVSSICKAFLVTDRTQEMEFEGELCRVIFLSSEDRLFVTGRLKGQVNTCVTFPISVTPREARLGWQAPGKAIDCATSLICEFDRAGVQQDHQ